MEASILAREKRYNECNAENRRLRCGKERVEAACIEMIYFIHGVVEIEVAGDRQGAWARLSLLLPDVNSRAERPSIINYLINSSFQTLGR